MGNRKGHTPYMCVPQRDLNLQLQGPCFGAVTVRPLCLPGFGFRNFLITKYVLEYEKVANPHLQ